jgi:phage-related protein
MDKPLRWVGSSRDDLRRFPEAVRFIAGYQPRRGQGGLDPNDWRPMPSAGPGVRETTLHTGLEHRALSVAKFAESVCVLHALEKRSRKTATADVEPAKGRLAMVVAERRTGRG